MELDRIDFALLAALQNDARLSNKELAAHVDLAPSSCLERVRRLTKAGILRGYHGDVAPEALGIGVQALIAVQLVKHSRDAFKLLYAYLLGLPEVLAVFHVSGVHDLQVHVAVRDVPHLQSLVVDSLATRREIARYETSVIFGFQRNLSLPCYRNEARSRTDRPRRTAASPKGVARARRGNGRPS